MRTKKIHVFPHDGGWVINAEASRAPRHSRVYSTQEEAIFATGSLVQRGSSEQIVIHREDGSVTRKKVYGRPVIPSSAVKSSLGRRAIRKAVLAVIRERLASK